MCKIFPDFLGLHSYRVVLHMEPCMQGAMYIYGSYELLDVHHDNKITFNTFLSTFTNLKEAMCTFTFLPAPG